VGGCHPPPSFFCIMRLIHMEYNFDFLSTGSCRIFVGTHFVAEVVLVSHATKKVTPEIAEVPGGGWYPPTPYSVDYTVYILIFKTA